MSCIHNVAGIQQGNQNHVDFLEPRLGNGIQLHAIGQVKSRGQPKVKARQNEPSVDKKSYKIMLNRVCIQGGVKHWKYICNQSITRHLCKSEQFCFPPGLSK